jgi:hypothetical protein
MLRKKTLIYTMAVHAHVHVRPSCTYIRRGCVCIYATVCVYIRYGCACTYTAVVQDALA